MLTRYLCLVLLLSMEAGLHAQDERRMRHEVYGGYTYLSNSFNGVPGARQPLSGWDASYAFPDWRNLHLKLETFSYRGTNLGAQQDGLFILAGGQYSRPWRRESLFGEVMLGSGGLNRYWGPNQSPGATATFATLLGGGLDTPVSRHFAVRVNAGYLWEDFALIQSVNYAVPYSIPGLPNNFFRLSSGVVWRF
jgi:hypothetical protein